MKCAEIERLLPGVFRRTLHRGGPLDALLGVMEDHHAPAEAIVAELERFFDPRRTPDSLVLYLARWVDLGHLITAAPREGAADVDTRSPWSTGVGRLRELIANAAHLSQWRGSARGLILFLEIATGRRGYAVDEEVVGEDGLPRPYHVRIRAPGSVAGHRRLIELIIESQKPAYVTFELEFEPAPLEGDHDATVATVPHHDPDD